MLCNSTHNILPVKFCYYCDFKGLIDDKDLPVYDSIFNIIVLECMHLVFTKLCSLEGG